jgi:hypothetical protein
MKTQEEFLELEIDEFEFPENLSEFEQLSPQRKNDILFKRLLFDYDEGLQIELKKFIKTNGNDPGWSTLIAFAPELKYIVCEPPDPITVAKIALKEITLE